MIVCINISLGLQIPPTCILWAQGRYCLQTWSLGVYVSHAGVHMCRHVRVPGSEFKLFGKHLEAAYSKLWRGLNPERIQVELECHYCGI